MEEFVEVCILAIPLQISNFYGAYFEIQPSPPARALRSLPARSRALVLKIPAPIEKLVEEAAQHVFYQDAIFEN